MELKIKEVLKSKGLTALSLAEMVGITQPNISNIINGKTNPSLETLEKIATALDVPISNLFESERELYGLVVFKGRTYKIDSIKSIETLLNDCNALTV